MRGPPFDLRRFTATLESIVHALCSICMRLWPQLPHSPIYFERTSGTFELPSVKKSSLSRVQPSTNLVLTKSPLAADFPRGNLSTFCPEAHGPWRDTEPSRNGCSRNKSIVLFTPWIKHQKTTPNGYRREDFCSYNNSSKQRFKIQMHMSRLHDFVQWRELWSPAKTKFMCELGRR